MLRYFYFIIAFLGGVLLVREYFSPAEAYPPPLSVAESDALSFGTVLPPTSGSGSVSITTSGGNSTSNITLVSLVSEGAFSITGDEGAAITIMITPAVGENGVDLTDMVGKYDTEDDVEASGLSPVSISNITASTVAKILKVGGKMTVASTAPAGSGEMSYSVNVSYE